MVVTLVFDVPGTPKPQGSKTIVVRRDGKRAMRESSKGLEPWRNAIVWHARQAIQQQGWETLDGPVQVVAQFRMPYLAEHLRTGKRTGEVKDWAPVWHTSYPDLDKLLRACGDALKIAGAVTDDSHIARWWHPEKRYSLTPGVHVEVSPL